MFGKLRPPRQRPLNIFVIGCGRIGHTLLDTLSKEGHNVTLIDKDERKVQDITAQFDVMGYTGNGASYRVLVDAGIQEADILMAVTHSDELNLLCCSVASQVSSCSTIARVRTPEYSEEVWYLRDKLGLTMVINPELETAVEISRIMNLPAALEVNSFARGEAEMVTFKVREDSKLHNSRLADLMPNLDLRMLFTVVGRDDDVFIPNGNYVFTSGDTVSYVAARRDGLRCLRELDLPTNRLKKCFIIGGGKIAYYLAKRLVTLGISVKLFEPDEDLCHELTEALPNVMVLNTDGTDINSLKEEGLDYTDAIVSLTSTDEVNVMLSLYATKYTEAKVITLIRHPASVELAMDLDIGSLVYPMNIASDMILAYTRARSISKEADIETLYHLFNNRAEAIEFHVQEDSPLTGIKLHELSLKDNVVIAFIYRNGKLIFPKGSDTIEPKDSVMIVTTNLGYRDITEILE